MDDAAAVPAAARVAAPDFSAADAAGAVTAAAAISNAARVAALSVFPAPARISSWPVSPEAISDVALFLD